MENGMFWSEIESGFSNISFDTHARINKIKMTSATRKHSKAKAKHLMICTIKEELILQHCELFLSCMETYLVVFN